MLCHDLRTPLSTILGSAELLADEIDPTLAPQQARRVGRILAALQRIEQLLDNASVLNHETRQCVAAWADLSEVARQAATGTGRIELEGCDAPSPGVFCAKEVRQALGNVVADGMKLSNGAGPVRVRVTSEEGRARFTVEDSGPSVAAGDAKRFFEPFAGGFNAASRTGAGLGLAVAQRLAEMIGGALALDAAHSPGRRFVLEFPFAQTPTTSLHGPPPPGGTP
jgi:signal transduction histidine kinase